MRATLVAGLVMLAAGSSRAAAPDGSFAIRGIGSGTCGELVKAVDARSPEVAWFAHWLDGYVTAVNRYRADTFDVAPWPGTRLLLMLVDAHCRGNRDQPLYEVVHQLVVLLGTQRLVDRSEPVEIRVGERRRMLYRAVVRRLQRALIERKLLADRADGIFGPRTRKAVAAFQRKAGLEATGFPDDETLYKLLLEPLVAGPAPAPGGDGGPAGDGKGGAPAAGNPDAGG